MPPDPFRDLRDKRVSQASQTVHPSGNPISHSTHVGFNEPLVPDAATASESSFERAGSRNLSALPVDCDGRRPSHAVGVGHCKTWRPSSPFTGTFVMSPVSFQSRAVGVPHVGDNPGPVAAVRGANGASWNAVPLRVIPERGQVSENSSEPPSKESCDVLHEDVPGSKLANETGVL